MEKAELLKQPLFFQRSVLSNRHYFKRTDLERINGRELYGKNIEIGDPGVAETLAALTISKVVPERSGLSAVANLEYEGKPANILIQLRFFIDKGNWRIDLWRTMKPTVVELEHKSGISQAAEPDVIETFLKRDLFPALAKRSGRPVTDAIWTPLAKQN